MKIATYNINGINGRIYDLRRWLKEADPVDRGDAPYRYHLLSISDHRVISDLYVEGESYEPENTTSPEITSFTISKNSILTVRAIKKNFGQE